MPRTAQLEPHKDDSRSKPWRVDLPASTSPTGKRQRFFFDTKQLALNFCDGQRIRLKNFGIAGTAVAKPAQIEQAANAFELLKPYGVTLNEVVTEWIGRRKANEASVPFEDEMDAFAATGTRRSASYKRSIRQTRNRLVSLHGKLLNTITPADLALAMDTMPASVRNLTIRILGGLFNFGAKRGHCALNPCEKLDLSERNRGEIQIHSGAEVAAILSAAETHDVGLVPFLAVSFFCGLRRAEALRLDWSAIDLQEDFVRLPGAITKTKRGRHIDITANCKAWLLPYAKAAGPVTPCTPDMLRKRLAALKNAPPRKEPSKEGQAVWNGHKVPTIKHGARHCFASYWLAKHGDIDLLCRSLGHDNPETTFKHYAKAATRREAEKFWAVMPAAIAGNVLAFQSKAAA